jgi:hypothetical protein
MHRDRQLDGTKACPGVAPDTRAGVDNILTHLVGHFLQIVNVQLSKVRR